MARAMSDAEFEAGAAHNRDEGRAQSLPSMEMVQILVGGEQLSVMRALARQLRLSEPQVLHAALACLAKEVARGDGSR